MRYSLTTFQLKIIAVIFMVIDHIGFFIEGTPVWFRYIGRLAAPLFMFCLCWGLDYTRNRRNYILRLYAASVAMAGLWCLFELCLGLAGIEVYFSEKNNIFTTLFIIAVLISLITDQGKSLWYKLLFILIWQTAAFIPAYFFQGSGSAETLWIAVSGSAFYCEGGLKWCILGVFLYFIKNSRKTLAIGYTGWCLVCEFFLSALAVFPRLLYFLEWHLGGENVIFLLCDFLYRIIVGEPYQFTPMTLHGLYFGNIQWLMLGALPFMLLYNHRKGASCKYFFYLIYPVHIFLLALCMALT